MNEVCCCPVSVSSWFCLFPDVSAFIFYDSTAHQLLEEAIVNLEQPKLRCIDGNIQLLLVANVGDSVVAISYLVRSSYAFT